MPHDIRRGKASEGYCLSRRSGYTYRRNTIRIEESPLLGSKHERYRLFLLPVLPYRKPQGSLRKGLSHLFPIEAVTESRSGIHFELQRGIAISQRMTELHRSRNSPHKRENLLGTLSKTFQRFPVKTNLHGSIHGSSQNEFLYDAVDLGNLFAEIAPHGTYHFGIFALRSGKQNELPSMRIPGSRHDIGVEPGTPPADKGGHPSDLGHFPSKMVFHVPHDVVYGMYIRSFGKEKIHHHHVAIRSGKEILAHVFSVTPHHHQKRTCHEENRHGVTGGDTSYGSSHSLYTGKLFFLNLRSGEFFRRESLFSGGFTESPGCESGSDEESRQQAERKCKRYHLRNGTEKFRSLPRSHPERKESRHG